MMIGKDKIDIGGPHLAMEQIIRPQENQQKLGGGFKYFVFSPLPGEMIQFD